MPQGFAVVANLPTRTRRMWTTIAVGAALGVLCVVEGFARLPLHVRLHTPRWSPRVLPSIAAGTKLSETESIDLGAAFEEGFKDDWDQFRNQLCSSLQGRLADESLYLHRADIYRSDNFWETTRPTYLRQRTAAAQSIDKQALPSVEQAHRDLDIMGLARRLKSQCQSLHDSDHESGLLDRAVLLTSRQLGLGKTQDEQLQDLRKRVASSKSLLYRALPMSAHVYLDFAHSLYKPPSRSELTRSVVVGGVFAAIVVLQQRIKSMANYVLMGYLASMSMLLTRGMKSVPTQPGAPPHRAISWSTDALKHAVVLTALIGSGVLLASYGALSLSSLPRALKAKVALSLSVFMAAMAAAYFEVYEDKNQNGSRWRRAKAMYLGDQDLPQLDGSESESMEDMYEHAYDPDVDDQPMVDKYVPDERLEGNDPACWERFNKWKQMRKEGRRPAVEKATSNDKWLGVKSGMFDTTPPSWLQKAYHDIVIRPCAWKSEPLQLPDDEEEVKLVQGPVGFRDKTPSWLVKDFSGGLWEEKVAVSRKVARAYGAYRKGMWKVDPLVVLQPCDGADKEDKKV